jgi:hypothetical protein
VTLFALLCTVAGLQAPAPDLPNPFTLKREQTERGNPLAAYIELLRLEPQYMEDPRWRDVLPEVKAMREQFLGDPHAAHRGLEYMYRQVPPQPDITSHAIDEMKPVAALPALVAAIGDRQIVMYGEEHHSPQSRSLVTPLLRELRKKGFSYFAVETFNPEVEDTQKQGFPDTRTGTYTDDPVFAEAVREAIRLGYKLVPYEHAVRDPNLSPTQNQDIREKGQAVNIKERILHKDPNAKVFVMGGRAHVSKSEAKMGDESFKFMALHFRELTGIDPFSIYAASYIGMTKPELERPLYRYAAGKGWLTRPTVFQAKDGKLWTNSEGLDVQVFWPRQQLVDGRPDWLQRDLGREPYRVPESKLANGKGHLLVQVFLQSEPERAIPVDQFLIRPGEPRRATMMLPSGKVWLRILDEEGEVERWEP